MRVDLVGKATNFARFSRFQALESGLREFWQRDLRSRGEPPTLLSTHVALLPRSDHHVVDDVVRVHGAPRRCDAGLEPNVRAAPRVAVLFKNLRKELDATLMRKIADPSLDVDAESAGLVRTIVELLESEETTKSETKNAPATDGTEREVNEAGGDDDGASS